MPTVTDLRVDSIVVWNRLRPLSEEAVAEIAESMAVVGLINPITIFRDGGVIPNLVAGAHRLAAAKRLGWETIPCLEYAGPEADSRRLAEIDENLIRVDLSPAERAVHIAARKEIYERVHPEATQGATGRGGKKDPNLRSFSEDTSKKTRRGKASIARDATRARQIPQIADVIGTTLDKGSELDALAKLPPEDQTRLIDAAKIGQAVTARPPAAAVDPPEPAGAGPATEPSPEDAADTLARWCNQFESHWMVASKAGREWATRYVLADMNAHKTR